MKIVIDGKEVKGKSIQIIYEGTGTETDSGELLSLTLEIDEEGMGLDSHTVDEEEDSEDEKSQYFGLRELAEL
jgi:hypothetical protein